MKTRCKGAIAIVLVMFVLTGQLLAAWDPPGRGRRSGRALARQRQVQRWSDVDPVPPGPMGPRGPWGPGPADPGMMLVRMLHRLDLTDEQLEQIRDIREAAGENIQAAADAVTEAAKALHEAVFNGSAEADIRAAAQALGGAIGDQAVLRAATLVSIKAVLTPEQLEQLQKMKERAAELRQLRPGPQGRGRFPGRRGPWSQRPRRGFAPGLGRGAGLDIETLFKNADADKDGKLTKQELQAQDDRPRPALQGIFDRADTDKDGALTVEELEAFKEAMQDRPRYRFRW